MARGLLVVLLVLAVASSAAALWILPGVAPRNYFAQDANGNQAYIDLKVNKMTSPRTQLPYAYYSLPFCKPQKIEDVRENLGEMLAGDKLENSQYLVRRSSHSTFLMRLQIPIKQNVPCRVLCRQDYGSRELRKFKERIDEEYRVHWYA